MSTEKVYGEVGLISDGDNISLVALLGTERVIDGTFSVAGLAGWTLGAGWSDGTGKAAKAADGVGTLTQAVAINAVVGTTYKIVYQVLDVTVDGVTLTYGGVSDVVRLTNNTYTFHVTAITTGSLILTPSSNGSRFSIDNVSVKALTDATGDLVVDGNLTVKSPVTFNSKLTIDNGGITFSDGQFIAPTGSSSIPGIGFVVNPATGFFISGGNIISVINGIQYLSLSSTTLSTPEKIDLGWWLDTYIVRDGAGVIALRNGTNVQTLKIYETYTDASNYERYALIASGNQLEIKAETLGTGVDDLDIALTPAGTGNVKFGTYGAEVALVAGYVTIKDALGNLRKLAVIA